MPSTANEWLKLMICYGEGSLAARELTYFGGAVYTLTTNSTNGYAGFGVGSITSTALFRNLNFRKGFATGVTAQVACPHCTASCDLGPGTFFNDGSGGPLGCTQISGTWSYTTTAYSGPGGMPTITGGHIETSSANSILRYDTVGAESGRMWQQVAYALWANGDVLKLYLNFVDADNCWILELTAATRTRVIIRSGGSDTVMVDTTDSRFLASRGASGGSVLFGYNQQTNRVIAVGGNRLMVLDWPATPTTYSMAIGLGATVSGTAAFNNWQTENCFDLDDCAQCEKSGQAVWGHVVADDVLVELAGTPYDGSYTLSYKYTASGAGYWWYDMGGGLTLVMGMVGGNNVVPATIGVNTTDSPPSVAISGDGDVIPMDCLSGSYSISTGSQSAQVTFLG